jgi:hypothetical protein
MLSKQQHSLKNIGAAEAAPEDLDSLDPEGSLDPTHRRVAHQESGME